MSAPSDHDRAHASTGRPRDPEVDRRIALAAVAVFGEAGWAGFSVESVARQAGVGKASIYLRWETKEQLLLDALAAHVAPVVDADTGSLRGDLTALARQLVELYAGPSRQAALRMMLEAPMIPGLAERCDQLRQAQVKAARAMVRRGIRRGDLPDDSSVTLLLDTLCGGVIAHILSTPQHLEEAVQAGLDEFTENLVGFLLGSTRT
ncbi:MULTISPECIES: TetR/AcrR family transcriptional regulator [Prauserella salsuginis group]|uniref:AcrR family transcriptional regulator n=2 Tax=Prauserella salsuginis group TaxID=2893672 RepID=A0A839XSY6_9PSEU|nr:MULTISPECIES: TetR/AcrR family transcriptional regulator [Prauserella salsuginis group]MBB3665129.1 AcrR family transcriptional regulator [Prauserella sediminis]MCR3718599.1 transcriptional regulator, TetR family [Prauserella flava]MCR3733169.1 transcriptional regulator, TetR family [Prauserella salsuginis]